MARVVGLGEVMIRLAPPGRQRIEQAHSFDIEIGGAELNTLVGLARLGHDCSLVTRLPDNPLGRLVRNRIREHGVGTEYVKLVDDGRQGLCFFEAGAEPRPSEVHYDRANSAMSRIQPDEFDWKEIGIHHDMLHVSGITPALSESAAATVELALRTAGEEGCNRTFDLNFRSKLWDVTRASACFDRLIRFTTILFASQGDAATLFGIEGDDFSHELIRRYGQLSDQGWLGCVAYTNRTEIGNSRGTITGNLVSHHETYQSREFSFDIVDRIGSGDAFAAGIINGFFSDELGLGVETATIMAALQHTIPGDLPIMTRDDIESVRANKTTGVRR